MNRWRAAVSLLLVTAVLLAVGCARKKTLGDWSATVDVSGTSATVTLKVDGLVMGRDYHPHLRLDGGPEVMLNSATYTFQNLTPGPHKVDVELSDPQHKRIPGAQKEIAFEIQ